LYLAWFVNFDWENDDYVEILRSCILKANNTLSADELKIMRSFKTAGVHGAAPVFTEHGMQLFNMFVCAHSQFNKEDNYKLSWVVGAAILRNTYSLLKHVDIPLTEEAHASQGQYI